MTMTRVRSVGRQPGAIGCSGGGSPSNQTRQQGWALKLMLRKVCHCLCVPPSLPLFPSLPPSLPLSLPPSLYPSLWDFSISKLLAWTVFSAFSFPNPDPPDLRHTEDAADSAASRGLDFGLCPSDAAEVCGALMDGGGGGGQLVSVGHPWHPGRLLHYGRAELKQSDHR